MSPVHPARLIAGAALAAGLTLLVAAPASAHDPVVGSTPSSGETLTELPARFSVDSAESMLYVGNDEVFGLWARDAAGLYYGDGCVEISGATMSTDAVLGAAGDYALVAEFISADGHATSVEIPFHWEPAGDVEPATGSATAPRCEPVPTPEPTATPAATASDEPAEEPAEESGPPLGAWVVVGVLALAALVFAAVVVTRRRRPTE